MPSKNDVTPESPLSNAQGSQESGGANTALADDVRSLRAMVTDLNARIDKYQGSRTSIRDDSFQSEKVNEDIGADELASLAGLRGNAMADAVVGQTLVQLVSAGWMGLKAIQAGMSNDTAQTATNSRVIHDHTKRPSQD